MKDLTAGVVGLGNMGGSIGRNLLEQGYAVPCYDVDETKVSDLVERGGTGADSPAEVAAQSDVVVTSLPDTGAARSVYLGEEGILAGTATELVAFEMSTIDPDSVVTIAERAEERNVSLVGTPVMGGPDGAERGDVTLLVSGDRDLVCRDWVQAFIEDLSAESIYTGEIGTGHTFKLVNNFIDLANNLVAMEAVSLASARGMDESQLLALMERLHGEDSRIAQRMTRAFEREYDTGFSIDYAAKDVGLYLDVAEAAAFPAHLGGLVFQQYTRARADGFGDADPSAVIEVYDDTDGS